MPSVCKPLLRYPGGKSRKRKQLVALLRSHLETASAFVEPFVGGGSVTLMVASLFPSLLLLINDRDPNIFAFWDLVVNGSDDEIAEMAALIGRGASLELFDAERVRCECVDRSRVLKAYHAVFFSKVTHNGIFHASPIGGRDQEGKRWKIDCQYEPRRLMETFHQIRSVLRGRTEVTGIDALALLELLPVDVPMYLDPPYFGAGRKCYPVWMTAEEHIALSEILLRRRAWVLSYDDCPEIRALYSWASVQTMAFKYSMASHGDVNKWSEASELVITPRTQ